MDTTILPNALRIFKFNYGFLYSVFAIVFLKINPIYKVQIDETSEPSKRIIFGETLLTIEDISKENKL